MALLFAAGLGLAAQLLWYGQLLGVNAVIGASLFLALAWRLRRRSIDPRDAWIPASALVFAALLAVRTEAALVVFDAIGATLFCLATAASLGAPITLSPVAVLIRRAVAALVAALVSAGPLIRLERSQPWHLDRLARVAPYAAGVGLSTPLLVVFVILFSSADEVFAHGVRDAFGGWADVPRELPGRTLLAAIVAWVSAGTFTLLWRQVSVANDVPRPLPRATVGVLFIAVDVVFALFVAVQVTFLFAGGDTVRAAGITYSGYARRGFFELVAAAIIVAAVLFLTDVLVERGRRWHRAPGVALIALTAVILASAYYRLDLYQRAYGWSELRFHAIAAVFFLALALAVLAWALVADRTARAIPPIVGAAVLVAIAVNVIGPSAFVARANLARVLDPSSLPADADRTLDVLYLYQLGDAAIPAIVESLPTLPENDRACIEALIRRRLTLRPLLSSDWRSWNDDRSRADDALRSFAAAIPNAGRDDHVADSRRATPLSSVCALRDKHVVGALARKRADAHS